VALFDAVNWVLPLQTLAVSWQLHEGRAGSLFLDRHVVPSCRMRVQLPVNSFAHSHTQHEPLYFRCAHSARILILLSCQVIYVRALELTAQAAYRVRNRSVRYESEAPKRRHMTNDVPTSCSLV
jgi:hypothetical protein